jgi:hypothetical protein
MPGPRNRTGTDPSLNHPLTMPYMGAGSGWEKRRGRRDFTLPCRGGSRPGGTREGLREHLRPSRLAEQCGDVPAQSGKLAFDDTPDEEVVHIIVTVDKDITKSDNALVFPDPRGQGGVAFCELNQRLATISNCRSTAARSIESFI